VNVEKKLTRNNPAPKQQSVAIFEENYKISNE